MTAAPLAHDGNDGAGDVQRAEEVGFRLGAERLVADLLEVAGLEGARVVDERVDAAEGRDGCVDGGLRRVRVGDVER